MKIFYYRLTLLILIVGAVYQPLSAQDILRLGDVSLLPGTQAVDVPLLLSNKTPVAGLEFSLRDDSAMVHVSMVTCVGRAAGFTAMYQNNKLLLYHASGNVIESGEGEIAQIRVTLGSSNAWETDSLRFAEPVILADKQGMKLEDVSIIGCELTTNETGIATKENLLPNDYALLQNYPNPFNPQTTIRFAVAEAGEVTLALYNLRGESVTTIVKKDYAPGYYSLPFQAGALSSGVYFCKMTVNGFSGVMKMVVMR